jgi:hypothetical protein
MPDHKPTVAAHFLDREPVVKVIYDRILAAARKLGPVLEDPKKTSIHLVCKTAFAGVATRKNALILTLKSETDVPSPRVAKRERASAKRWYFYVRLTQASEVDRELVSWLRRSYEICGGR